MNAILLQTPEQVVGRLEQLGLTKEQLLSGVEAMVGGRASCTLNDPPSAPGYTAWKDGTRRLREILIPNGWVRSEDGQLSSVFNKELNIKLVASNTDEGTGLEDSYPQQTSKKGAATDRAVCDNQVLVQDSFLSSLDATMKVIPLSRAVNSTKTVYWYLCVYSDRDVVRAELSCPVVCEGGYFKDFYERIILIGKDDDNGTVRARKVAPDNDGDSSFEINVTRKQA